MPLPITDIRGLKRHEVLLAFAAFLCIVAPGVLTLCFYDVDLVKTLTTPKLLLISASITLPLVTINAAFISFVSYAPKKDLQDPVESFVYSCIATSIAYYVVLLICFVAGLSKTTFVYSLVGAEAVCLFALYRLIRLLAR